MHNIKPFNQVTIIGRRWFRRSAGNTYSSVDVYVDGEFIGYKKEGGYSDYYKQMAHDILMEKGYYPKTGICLSSGANKDLYEFFNDIRENRNMFVCSVSDVAREKDL
jgi:hypothetical protein